MYDLVKIVQIHTSEVVETGLYGPTFEAHTQRIQHLACLTNFPDKLLCTFYLTSLNAETMACLPGVGPRGNFAEWVLENSGAANTIFPAEDSSPTPTDTEPNMPSSLRTDMMPEPLFRRRD